MKVFVLISCAFAVTAASWAPTHKKYHGPLHYPVIHKGVPVEPEEVQYARDAHLIALSKESEHASYHHEEHDKDHHDDGQYRQHEHGDLQDDGQYRQHEEHHDDGEYRQHEHGDLQDDGQYREHEEYQHHKEQHNNHHDDGQYRQHEEYHQHEEQHDNQHDDGEYRQHEKHQNNHYSYGNEKYHHEHKHIVPAYETSYVKPAIGHDGKPLDTPEVEAAKAHHFDAFHKALSLVASHGVAHAANHYYRQRRSIHAQHIPIINEHGVPVEPLAVQHARAEHLAHHSGAYYSGYEHHNDYSYDNEHVTDVHPHSHKGHADLDESTHGYILHQKHAPVYGHHHADQYFVPKYDYHGLPLDTKEVEHLKALHFAAHAKALNY